MPPICELLACYEDLFSYEFDLPKNWHSAKGVSKYSMTVEPEGADNTKFGVCFTVDLLVEEFGQNVTDQRRKKA